MKRFPLDPSARGALSPTRRALLAGLGAGALLPPTALGRDTQDRLPVTPSDVEGPFYPAVPPADADNDLLRVAVPTQRPDPGQTELAPGRAVYLQGQVLDPGGGYVAGARVELWQCDHGGVYHHPHAPGQADARFQGYGSTTTAWQGDYHFRTIRPVPYVGRTPHIHLRVTAPGYRSLTTQLYDAARVQENALDQLYLRHAPAQRELLSLRFQPLKSGPMGPLSARFDVVLAYA